jgi:hypothetical protein
MKADGPFRGYLPDIMSYADFPKCEISRNENGDELMQYSVMQFNELDNPYGRYGIKNSNKFICISRSEFRKYPARLEATENHRS